jgi:hypothetical protein
VEERLDLARLFVSLERGIVEGVRGITGYHCWASGFQVCAKGGKRGVPCWTRWI